MLASFLIIGTRYAAYRMPATLVTIETRYACNIDNKMVLDMSATSVTLETRYARHGFKKRLGMP